MLKMTVFPSLSSKPFNGGTSQAMTKQTNVPLGAQLLHPQKGTHKAVFQTTVPWKPNIRQLILFHNNQSKFLIIDAKCRCKNFNNK
jgi:hypothetical protein